MEWRGVKAMRLATSVLRALSITSGKVMTPLQWAEGVEELSLSCM